MQIALYIMAIIVVCASIVLYFVLSRKKHEKRIKELNLVKNNTNDVSQQESNKIFMETKAEPVDEKIEKKEENKESAEPVVDPKLESFSLQPEKKEEKPGLKAIRKRPFVNPFDFDDFKDDEVDGEKDTLPEQSTIDFDDFEEFMRENNIDEDDFDKLEDIQNKPDEDKTEIKPAYFDLSVFKGKSKEEILEMTKDLPPEVQEVVLSECLGEKNEEE